jgi:hypothetical protein
MHCILSNRLHQSNNTCKLKCIASCNVKLKCIASIVKLKCIASIVKLKCIALCQTEMHCIVSNWSALHCVKLKCIALCQTEMHCMHQVKLKCIASCQTESEMQCIMSNWNALHCVKLKCIALCQTEMHFSFLSNRELYSCKSNCNRVRVSYKSGSLLAFWGILITKRKFSISRGNTGWGCQNLEKMSELFVFTGDSCSLRPLSFASACVHFGRTAMRALYK